MNKEALELLRSCATTFALELSAQELGLFDLFAEELKKWNRKINLTAIKDDREIVIKHFVDSLSLLGCLRKSGKLLDIGSGGGFPAIPLKIMLPELAVVSVDAVEKKILFQRHAARLLRLPNFTALHARVEDLAKNHAEEFDTIVSRAFAELPLFITLALPLLKPTGQIIAMKGREGKDESLAAEKNLASLGVKIVECIHLQLPSSGAERCLVVMAKKREEFGQ